MCLYTCNLLHSDMSKYIYLYFSYIRLKKDLNLVWYLFSIDKYYYLILPIKIHSFINIRTIYVLIFFGNNFSFLNEQQINHIFISFNI